MSNLLRLGCFLLGAALVHPAAIQTCGMQSSCIDMKLRKLTTSSSSTPCSSRQSPSCAWEVCMVLDLTKAGCQKAATDTVSHMCKKEEFTCGGGNWIDQEATSLPDGFQHCQTGPAGGTLQFLLKDGSGGRNNPGCAGGAALRNVSLGSGATMSCAPSTSQACTGNAIGVECIWTVQLPDCGGFAVTVKNVPEAVSDTFSIEQGGKLENRLDTNDIPSPDGGNKYSLETPATSGTVYVYTDGAFQYTPNLGFSGIDLFTYKITDADGDSSVAAVSITVKACERCPEVTETCKLYEQSLYAQNSQYLTADVHNCNPASLASILSDYDCQYNRDSGCNALQCGKFIPQEVLNQVQAVKCGAA